MESTNSSRKSTMVQEQVQSLPSEALAQVLHGEAICRICYAEEFSEGNGEFIRPTPCNCLGFRSAVHVECLRKWQTQAKKNRQWGAGSICHACESPYLIDLSQDIERISVGVLGGTGLVGRQLAAILKEHPVFSLGTVVGSADSVGKLLSNVWEEKEAALQQNYGSSVWKARSCPATLDGVQVESFEDLLNSNCHHVISSIAPRLGHLEDSLQQAGKLVVSISPHARNDPRNVLIVPECNFQELVSKLQRELAKPEQERHLPMIKSPNCVTCGVSMVLKAIDDRYGVDGVSIATFQALSGRGDAKYDPSLVVGNVYPLTGTDENTDAYQRQELLRMFPSIVRCSVAAHRVPVQTGHFVDIKIQTRETVANASEVEETLTAFNPLQSIDLPLQPRRPIVVVKEAGRPRPLQDSNYEKGMAVCVGNVRTEDGFFDVTLSMCVNNEVRGAWGAALINLELYELYAKSEALHAFEKSQGRSHSNLSTPNSPENAKNETQNVESVNRMCLEDQ